MRVNQESERLKKRERGGGGGEVGVKRGCDGGRDD